MTQEHQANLTRKTIPNNHEISLYKSEKLIDSSVHLPTSAPAFFNF